METMTILRKKEKESAKLRMVAGGAWTINMDVLDKKRKLPDAFEYITEKGKYYITYKDAFDQGFIRLFGGESKLVVPIHCWEFTGGKA